MKVSAVSTVLLLVISHFSIFIFNSDLTTTIDGGREKKVFLFQSSSPTSVVRNFYSFSLHSEWLIWNVFPWNCTKHLHTVVCLPAKQNFDDFDQFTSPKLVGQRSVRFSLQNFDFHWVHAFLALHKNLGSCYSTAPCLPERPVQRWSWLTKACK